MTLLSEIRQGLTPKTLHLHKWRVFKSIKNNSKRKLFDDQLFMSWKKVRLGEVCDIFNGKTPSKSEQRDSGFPVLKIKDVDEFRRFKGIFESYVDENLAKKSPTKIVKHKDILILNAAHSVTHVASKMYLAEKSVEGVLATGEWTMVRTKENSEPNFIYYFLDSRSGKNQLKDVVKGIHLYPKDVANLQIPLPNLQTQKHIASILDKADALRQQNRQLLDYYDALLQSTFIEMFGDPATNPKGWEVKELKHFGKVKTGNTPPRDEEDNYGNFIEWIKTDNISPNKMHPENSKEYLSEKGLKIGRWVDKHSIIVTCIAGSYSSIGNVALTDRKVAFNQQMNSLSPNEKVDPIFLYMLFKVNKKYIQDNTTQGMKRIITKSVFENLTMIFPPLERQKHFANIVEYINFEKEKARQSLAESEALFQGLLAGYFGDN